MTTPTIIDIDAALHWLETEPNAPKHFTKAGNEHSRETIQFALRFTKLCMGEPSGDAIIKGVNHYKNRQEFYADGVFKAMIEQIKKEALEG